MMSEDYRYYRVSLSNIKAIIGIGGNKEVKTIDCSNHEMCYYSSVMENGKCPRYCMVVVEAKHYAYGKRKTRAEVYEMQKSEVMKEAKPAFV
ncbi:MAG: hypothetical protein R6U44_01900 [Archaeoglobaceae archaeon]